MRKNIIFVITLFVLSIALFGCGSVLIEPYKYDDTNYKTGNMSFSTPINKINVDWIVGDIIIDKSETQEIIIREDMDVNQEDVLKMHYCLTDDVLDIKFCGNTQSINHNFKIKKLYIYLPTQINEIHINNISSDITIDNVTINKLEIDNISGDIDFEHTNINELDINNTSGSILLFYSSIANIDIENISGTIGISYDETPKSLEIESVSGGISIYITDKENVSFVYETVSGNFKTNLEYTKDKNTYTFNNSVVTFTIETVSGYFKVLKK